MAKSAVARVKKELAELAKEGTPPVRLALVTEENFLHLVGEIDGPADTVYQGGVWKVDIVIPANYPFEPPKMKFVTHLWHPNVSSQTGAICLDILKDQGGQWSPALTMRTALMSLQALMCAPEPKDPQDAVVAGQYVSDRAGWEAKAREWTRTYAAPAGAGGGGGAPPPPPPPPPPAAAPPPPPTVPKETPAEWRGAVEELMAMGFEGDKALAALRAARGNLQLAAERLLMG
jgi:ubiquitin-conjugating enzyme (huntingtin interacting protein 2)